MDERRSLLLKVVKKIVISIFGRLHTGESLKLIGTTFGQNQRTASYFSNCVKKHSQLTLIDSGFISILNPGKP